MAHIFVIAGHGAGDPGATGSGYNEAERVRALAKRIAALGGSNVTLGDVNRDYYADNGISTLNISKDWQIVELHMDGSAPAARGGHVIIQSGFEADRYDNALADFISSILPGRAQKVVPRNDLANPARAAQKGYSYRLLECGFITNSTDISIFNSKMDEIAKGILSAFEIKSAGPVSKKVTLYDWNRGDNQRWIPEKQKDGTYMIRNKKTGLYLDVADASSKSGATVQCYSKNSTKAQKWTINVHTEPFEKWLIFKAFSGFVMDVSGGSDANGTKIQTYKENNTIAQKWILLYMGDGSYGILNQKTGKALDCTV